LNDLEGEQRSQQQRLALIPCIIDALIWFTVVYNNHNLRFSLVQNVPANKRAHLPGCLAWQAVCPQGNLNQVAHPWLQTVNNKLISMNE
jgi:hypothetical protein